MRAPAQTAHIAEPGALRPPQGRSLLIIVPAWKRVELAAVCYRQHAQLCDRLRARGLDAHVLVIADDDNLDAADDAGLRTLEHRNRLGEKLNAGYSHAARHGYDYAVALGSDSWMHPDRFAWLPDQNTILCTRNYVCVSPDGRRQGHFRINYDGGVGSRIFPLEVLRATGYKPVESHRNRGCDTATLRSIYARNRQQPAIVYTDLHPFEVVGFQSGVQITDYRLLEHEHLHAWMQPFEGLPEHFSRRLTSAAQRFYTHYAAEPEAPATRDGSDDDLMARVELHTVTEMLRVVANDRLVAVLRPGQRIPVEQARLYGLISPPESEPSRDDRAATPPPPKRTRRTSTATNSAKTRPKTRTTSPRTKKE